MMDRLINYIVPVLAICLCSCATPSSKTTLDTTLPDGWANKSTDYIKSESFASVAIFDADLMKLLSIAIDDNLDIEIARHRLSEARAIAAGERARFWPTLSFETDTRYQASLSGSPSNSPNLALAGQFDPDLSGAKRASLAGAKASLLAREASLEEAKRLTAIAVIEEYILFQRASLELKLLEEAIGLQSELYGLIKLRHSAGLLPDVDLARADADLATSRADLGALFLQQHTARQRLGILLGQAIAPELVSLSDREQLKMLVGWPDVGVPLDLVTQRPDMRVSRQEFETAKAEAGIEYAARNPVLSIPGQISLDPTAAGSFGAATIASISANLALQLFDGGRRSARIDAAEALTLAVAAVYRSNLLTALSEVELALSTVENRQFELNQLEKAVVASQSAYEQLNSLYESGLTNFSDVLIAQRTFITNSRNVVTVSADLAAAKLSLHAALGGTMLTDNGDINAKFK